MSISFYLAAVLALTQAAVDREPVADTDRGSITRFVIDCGGAMRGDRAKCHAIEQRKLSTRLYERWFDAAVQANGLSLTSADDAAFDKEAQELLPFQRRMADHNAQLAAAALRVRQGEAISNVQPALADHGIAAREFERYLEMVPTLEIARRAASTDKFAELQRAHREDFRHRILKKRLAEIVRRRADAQHVAFEVAEEALWKQMIALTRTRIIDHSFDLPSLQGVLSDHETTLRID